MSEDNEYIKLSEEMVLLLGKNGSATFNQFMHMYDHGLTEKQVRDMVNTMEYAYIIRLNHQGLYELTRMVGSLVYANLLDQRSKSK